MSTPSSSPSSSRPAWSQGNDAIKSATSILDYVFRELAVSYLGRHDLAHVDQSEFSTTTLGKGIADGKTPVSSGLTRGHKLSVVSGKSDAPAGAAGGAPAKATAPKASNANTVTAIAGVSAKSIARRQAGLRTVRGNLGLQARLRGAPGRLP